MTILSVVITGIGVIANRLVTAINGGMPVTIGQTYYQGVDRYVPIRDARLPFLGDVINFRGDSYSLGDLLILAGLCLTAISLAFWLFNKNREAISCEKLKALLSLNS
jgi:hypothetical protein